MFDELVPETEVSGDMGTSSSGPDTSGRDFTKSFRKSNLLSDRIHCFLQTDIQHTLLQTKVFFYTNVGSPSFSFLNKCLFMNKIY